MLVSCPTSLLLRQRRDPPRTNNGTVEEGDVMATPLVGPFRKRPRRQWTEQRAQPVAYGSA